MNQSDQTLLYELCEKLSGGSWDQAEITSAAKDLALAIDDPDTYTSENLEAAWIAEECKTGWIGMGFDPEEAMLEFKRLAKRWAMLDIFLSVGAFGDKADEIVEQVIDLFGDVDLELPPFPTEKFGYEWYEPYLNAAIADVQPEHGGFQLIYFGQPFDDNLYLAAVYRPDVDRILELSDHFEFKLSTSCWGNTIYDNLHLPPQAD
jgi:hypothetical protein